MREDEFWREVRRGLITIARALLAYRGWKFAVVLLGVDREQSQ